MPEVAFVEFPPKKSMRSISPVKMSEELQQRTVLVK